MGGRWRAFQSGDRQVKSEVGNCPKAPVVPQRKRTGSWDTFERRYRPIDAPGEQGYCLRDWHQLPKPKPEPNFIWTVCDCGGRDLILCPGYCVVNRVGYVVCEVPWDDSEFSNTGYRY